MIGILKIAPKALSSMCFGFSMVSQTFLAHKDLLTNRTFVGMFRLHMLISGTFSLEYLGTCSTCDSIRGNSILRFSWVDQRCWYSVWHRYRFHLNICSNALLVCSEIGSWPLLVCLLPEVFLTLPLLKCLFHCALVVYSLSRALLVCLFH